MERIKSLDRYQKGVLLVITIMVLVFTAAYFVIASQKGFEYKDAILIPKQENGNTIYSGKIEGKQASFTVYADKTTEFKYGDKTYGPYTAKEDPSAIPEDSGMGDDITGIEFRCGEEIIFRGGVLSSGDHLMFYNKDGELEYMDFSVTVHNGTVIDENGNVIDQMKPSISTILGLMAGPVLTHKGEWPAWFAGVFTCIIIVISILFADELFHWKLAFEIRNADRAEPSDWEIAGRYFSWTIMTGLAMIIFIMGLW
ncbi:MAG: hypothetical protein K2K35_00925 [Lachnospiraceae bacterium]|nr:hypothetical protein [Lachnospiraceae bacterium]